jgi:hypothetical protein
LIGLQRLKDTVSIPRAKDHPARESISQKREANQNENHRNEGTSVSQDGVCAVYSFNRIAGPIKKLKQS